ncbi:uncharacterized protein LOC131230548 [Magnolia sinica]|uniref:uncharacterized protein LOC131230548 n=1 Tax=Magnolia sinica TaxID=86752 RepID=UPI00265ACB73|nr:uncharacterized protein LOC131230548 [Magnolia sinica]
MLSLSRRSQEAWIIAGDFNAVVNLDEKRGIHPPNHSSMTEFADAIQSMGLIDAGFSGARYTWCNNQNGNAQVWARLNRVLMNSSWANRFSLFRVEHLPCSKSDHAPLRLAFPSLSPPKIQKTEEELEIVDSRLQIDPIEALCQEHLQIKQKLEELELKEEVFWKQKSRNAWLDEGDRNTSFFHTSVTERTRRATIHSITLDDGTVLTNQEDIKVAAVSYFQTLFQEEEVSFTADFLCFIPHCVLPQDNASLQFPPSREEVYSALKSIPKDGAAGPDGFSASFFIECWNNVGKDVHKAAKAMFAGMISQEQGAFIKGRYMAENIALAQEALRDINRKARGGNLTLKLDLEKAYDRVNWSYLKQALHKFGFNAKSV